MAKKFVVFFVFFTLFGFLLAPPGHAMQGNLSSRIICMTESSVNGTSGHCKFSTLRVMNFKNFREFHYQELWKSTKI